MPVFEVRFPKLSLKILIAQIIRKYGTAKNGVVQPKTAKL